MRFSFKIGFTAFLVYLAFAVGNLFSSVGQFIPLIYFDTFFLPVCAVIFIWKKMNRIAFLALLFIAFSFLLSAWVEFIGPLEKHEHVALVSLFFALLSITLHGINTYQEILSHTKWIQLLWGIFYLCISLSIAFVFINFLFSIAIPYSSYLYWTGGISGIILAETADRKKIIEEENYRIILLFSLSSLFDLINYLSFLAVS